MLLAGDWDGVTEPVPSGLDPLFSHVYGNAATGARVYVGVIASGSLPIYEQLAAIRQTCLDRKLACGNAATGSDEDGTLRSWFVNDDRRETGAFMLVRRRYDAPETLVLFARWHAKDTVARDDCLAFMRSFTLLGR